MMQILGDFIERDTSDTSDFLMINFSATSTPLKQRWRNNGLSADFLADYLTTFLSCDDDKALQQRAELKDNVNFVANELLENAMKFNFPASKYPIRLFMGLEKQQILLYVSNYIDASVVENWQYKLNKMLTGDTHKLFMEQLIKNDKEQNIDSGLGYLSMINDWNAKFAWKFESVKDDINVQKVTVMAKVLI